MFFFVRPRPRRQRPQRRGRGGGRAAAAPRTKYAELAPGFPSPKKNRVFFSVLDVFKISRFFGVFFDVFGHFGRVRKYTLYESTRFEPTDFDALTPRHF